MKDEEKDKIEPILSEGEDLAVIIENTDNQDNSEKSNSQDEKSNPKQEIQDLKDKYLRLLAEFENYKKRSAKERIDLTKYAGQEVITSLLTILDDFERETKLGQATEGSKLIHNKLHQILKQKGLHEMESNGVDFDPALHEAITEFAVSDDQKNKVIDTVEKGYYLSDKIIRYAKVVVGK